MRSLLDSKWQTFGVTFKVKEAFAEAPVTRLDLQLCRVLKSLGINIQVCPN